MSKVYSRAELERIFARATELETDTIASIPSGDTYSLSEIRAIAVASGIDPVLVERAAREVVPTGASRAKGIISREVEISFPTKLSEERSLRVLSTVRSAVRQQGTGEASQAGFSWTSDDKTLLITAHDEDGVTRMKIFTRGSPALIISSILGVVAGMVTAGDPITMGSFFGGITVGVGVAAGLTGAGVRKLRRRASSVMAAVSRTIMDSDLTADRSPSEDSEAPHSE